VEVLTSVGTFLATSAAFVSVGLIVLYHEDPHLFWTSLIVAGWAFGVLMQTASGALAHRRS